MSSFNNIAKYYNVMTGYPGRIDRLGEAITPWVDKWDVGEALDAGCGNGVLMFALQKRNINVVGVDVAEPMLRLALDNARALGTTVDVRSATYASVGQLFPSRLDAVFALGNALVGAANDREMVSWLTGLRDSLRTGGHALIQMLNPTPFLKGNKTLIARRQTDGYEFVRFAHPHPDKRGLTFCLTMTGPDDSFESTVQQWPAWDHRRLLGCFAEAGFTGLALYGSLQRDEFAERSSTDIVIAAERG